MASSPTNVRCSVQPVKLARRDSGPAAAASLDVHCQSTLPQGPASSCSSLRTESRPPPQRWRYPGTFRRIAAPAAGDLAVGPPQHGDDQADAVEHGLLIPAAVRYNTGV
eukprot:767746-Hanusia_phi.AAC.1